MPDNESQTPPPPAVADNAPLEAFDSWASRNRRRAALDGAWRVEVSERVLRGAVTRSVTSWHDRAQSQPQPSRQKQRQQCSVPPRRKQPTRRALGTQTSHEPTKKQQRSALRSAANHRKRRVRALRRVLNVVLFYVRLWRAMMVTLAMRDVPHGTASPASPGKRRHSDEPLDGEEAPEVGDVPSPPQPKRPTPSAPPPGLRQGFLLR